MKNLQNHELDTASEQQLLADIAKTNRRTAKNIAFFTWITIISIAVSVLVALEGVGIIGL